MTFANNSGSGHKSRAEGSFSGQRLPQAHSPSPQSQPLSLRDLRLHQIENPPNPYAKQLADRYAPEIIAMLKRGKHAQEEAKREKTAQEKYFDAHKQIPFQDSDKDWELSEEDIKALEQIPL